MHLTGCVFLEIIGANKAGREGFWLCGGRENPEDLGPQWKRWYLPTVKRGRRGEKAVEMVGEMKPN